MQAGTARWRTANRWLYRTAHRLAGGPGRAAARCRRALGPLAPVAAGVDAEAPLLVLAGGRLGDALLAAGWTRHYRAWFGRPIVVVGRPETAAVVAPLVTAFVPFAPAQPWSAPHGGAALIAALRPWLARGLHGVAGDLHVFHGNVELQGLAQALGAERTVLYDGWIERALQAPVRRWPRSAVVVPGMHKPAGIDAERRHVLRDLAHWHRELLRAFAIEAEVPTAPWIDPRHRAAESIAGLDLPDDGDYVACHLASSQGKKDWPAAAWTELLATLAPQRCVLLGQRDDGPAIVGAHVLDLRGRTNVAQALAVAARARAFVGVDSGLAHAAALAGVPTVLPLARATEGYFFPYPSDVDAHTRVVTAAAYAACAGCGGLCAHEPLWRSRAHGLPCLRAVDVDAVLRELRAAIALRALPAATGVV